MTRKHPSILNADVKQIKVLCDISIWLYIDTDIYSLVSVWGENIFWDFSLTTSHIISE